MYTLALVFKLYADVYVRRHYGLEIFVTDVEPS